LPAVRLSGRCRTTFIDSGSGCCDFPHLLRGGGAPPPPPPPSASGTSRDSPSHRLLDQSWRSLVSRRAAERGGDAVSALVPSAGVRRPQRVPAFDPAVSSSRKLRFRSARSNDGPSRHGRDLAACSARADHHHPGAGARRWPFADPRRHLADAPAAAFGVKPREPQVLAMLNGQPEESMQPPLSVSIGAVPAMLFAMRLFERWRLRASCRWR